MSKKPVRSQRDRPLFRPLSPRETVKLEAWDQFNIEKLEEWEGPDEIARAASVHFRRGVEACKIDDYDAALTEFREVMRLMPDFGRTHMNVGLGLAQKSEFAAAVVYFEEAIRRSPLDRDAHFDLAICLLGQGDFERGWPEYEWRPGLGPHVLEPRLCRQPRWDGSPLDGRTLLVHCEQGHGDTFQFIRFLSKLREQQGRIVLAAHKNAIRLIESSPDIVLDELVCREDKALPPHDVQIPLLSLPLIYGTTLQTIPGGVPYLQPDSAEVTAWREQLEPIKTRKVGLAWAGNASHENDKRRSMRLADFAPLKSVSGITRFSLQKGDASGQVRQQPELLEFVPMLTDFADTAALIACLDLVITVDTSVAHLAGAMGKPVWVLLSKAGEWRWLRDRDDSPWYPTMRVWRQSEEGNWAELVGRVAAALQNEVNAAKISR